MSRILEGEEIQKRTAIMHQLGSLSLLFPLAVLSSKTQGLPNFGDFYDLLLGDFTQKSAPPLSSLTQVFSSRESLEKIFQIALCSLFSHNRDLFGSEDPVILQCFLQELGDGGGSGQSGRFVYFPRALFYSEDVLFPFEFKEELIEQARREREKLFTELHNKISIAIENHRNQPIRLYSLIYHLLWRYLWAIPSIIVVDGATYFSNNVSLFEFLRLYSVYTLSLFSEYNLSLITQLITQHSADLPLDRLKFLHIKGDISGIQNFLAGTKNVTGTARRLRGKSFFLSLLDRLTSLYFLWGLGYPSGHVIYSSGGHFEIILGFDEELLNSVDRMSYDLENYLLSSFCGELGLVTVKYVYTLKELFEKGYDTIISRVLYLLGEAKKKKFVNLLCRISDEELAVILNRDLSGKTQKRICPACGKYLFSENEGETCHWCETFFEMGKALPDAKVLIYVPGNSPRDTSFLEMQGCLCKAICDLGPLGKILLSRELPSISQIDESMRIFLINDTRIVREKKTIADSFMAVEQHIPFYNTSGQVAITFESLAEASRGDAKLAYAKGDMDNLGYLLHTGLRTFKLWLAISSLSTHLDLFFSGYLRYFLSTSSYKDHIYTLYAGGDDFLLIGSWNEVLKFLNKLREKFYRYTGKNERLHFSAGVVLSSPHYPVKLAFSLVSDALEEAKQRKPAIHLFNETISWKSFEYLFTEMTERIYKFIMNDVIERTFLYKIYQLLKQYKELEARGDIRKYTFYPRFYYYLNRNIASKDIKKMIINWLLDVERDYQVREEAIVKLKYVLTLSRGR